MAAAAPAFPRLAAAAPSEAPHRWSCSESGQSVLGNGSSASTGNNGFIDSPDCRVLLMHWFDAAWAVRIAPEWNGAHLHSIATPMDECALHRQSLSFWCVWLSKHLQQHRHIFVQCRISENIYPGAFFA